MMKSLSHVSTQQEPEAIDKPNSIPTKYASVNQNVTVSMFPPPISYTMSTASVSAT